MENKKKVIYIIEDDISINHGIAFKTPMLNDTPKMVRRSTHIYGKSGKAAYSIKFYHVSLYMSRYICLISYSIIANFPVIDY